MSQRGLLVLPQAHGIDIPECRMLASASSHERRLLAQRLTLALLPHCWDEQSLALAPVPSSLCYRSLRSRFDVCSIQSGS